MIQFLPGGSSPVITSTAGTIPFNYTNASISDEQGNFLFFTNGIEIYDRNLQVLAGGLVQTPYTILYASQGLNRPQNYIFLPWPGDSNKYILFYCAPELQQVSSGPCAGGWGWLSTHLYYTVLDKSLNGGNGGIVSASNVALIDTLVHANGLAVTKHANGRDWWIVVKERCSSNYNIVLFTPSGVQLLFTQSIGPVFSSSLDAAISRFSPDGTIYALIRDDYNTIYYKFDRCTGFLSDPLLVNSGSIGDGYLEFSPDSRFVYRSSGSGGGMTSQYDLSLYYQPSGVQNSQLFVDPPVPDTSDCGFGIPGSANAACFPTLAPNGKIYWGHCYSCNLSIINYPDSLDTLCAMEYNTVLLPMPHSGCLPYFAHYRLGPVTGSICDSLTSIHELKSDEVSLYPNPAKDHITLQSKRSLSNAVITLMNVQGQVLFNRQTATGTGFEVELPRDMGNGIYFLRIHSTEGVVSKKLVVQR
ncbi:MAG: T9SS type A sorting domain-containing protein [Bacteroidia bacterium]